MKITNIESIPYAIPVKNFTDTYYRLYTLKNSNFNYSLQMSPLRYIQL